MGIFDFIPHIFTHVHVLHKLKTNFICKVLSSRRLIACKPYD